MFGAGQDQQEEKNKHIRLRYNEPTNKQMELNEEFDDDDDAFGCFISIKSHPTEADTQTHTPTTFRYEIKTAIDIIEMNPSIFASCFCSSQCMRLYHCIWLLSLCVPSSSFFGFLS